jgi:hypothetical protein
MKKLLIVMISLALAGGASAQHFVGHGFYGGSRVIVSGGYYPYPYYGFGFGPFYPYYPYGYGYPYSGTSRMQMQIENIKRDYKDKIWSARRDTSLTRKERRAKVHELKQERDNAIADVKKNYYKQ